MIRPLARLLSLAAFVGLVAAPLVAQQPALDSLAGSTVLSLDEALQRALPASETVALARVAVLRARGEERQSRSEFFPQINGTASYTRTLKSQFSRASGPTDTTVVNSCNRFTADPAQPTGTRVDSLESALECLSRLNPLGSFSNLPFGQKNQYNLGLTASQTLFAGGRIRAQTKASGYNRRAAEIGLSAQEAQLTLDVTQAYYDAALSDRLLAIARGSLQLADSTYDQTRLAQQVGAQPEYDVLRAQVTRDNQRTTVIQREADRVSAFLKLKQLLNLPLDAPLLLTTVVIDSVLPIVPAIDTLIERTPDTATADRAPVRQAEATVAQQHQRLTVAKAERFPVVMLTSTFSRLGYPRDLLPSWGDFVTDWSAGISVKVPLFTGGRIGGSIQVANAVLEDARLKAQQIRERAAVDSRNSLEKLRAARAAWDASQGTVGQAERAYAIATIRFREGISTQTELADSRILLEQSRANRATSARDLQIARVRVALLNELPLPAQ
ncbi:MAG: TolC family protein [Gemmatimonadales bacterium]